MYIQMDVKVWLTDCWRLELRCPPARPGGAPWRGWRWSRWRPTQSPDKTQKVKKGKQNVVEKSQIKIKEFKNWKVVKVLVASPGMYKVSYPPPPEIKIKSYQNYFN